jgi:hypothetical protein
METYHSRAGLWTGIFELIWCVMVLCSPIAAYRTYPYGFCDAAHLNRASSSLSGLPGFLFLSV